MGNGNLQSCFISIGAYQYLCSATSQKGRGDSHPSGLNVYMKPLLAGPNSSWLSVHTPFHFLSILAKTLSCTRPRSASCIAKAQRGAWEMELVQCAWSIRSCQFFYFSFYPMVLCFDWINWHCWGWGDKDRPGVHRAMGQCSIFRDINTG